jgi:hypothetical protein
MVDRRVLRRPFIKLDELALFLRTTNTTVSDVVSLGEQDPKDGASSTALKPTELCADTLDSEARSSKAMSLPVRASALGI